MGTLSYTTECGPDGQTLVDLAATNHATPTLNGITVELGADGLYHFSTGPGEHTVIWYGPGANPQDGIVEWGRKTITIPARTDCAPDETTTTQAQATTTSPPATTAFAPPSTIATGTSLDLDVPVTTIAISGSTLPATATSSTVPLAGSAGVLLVLGVVAALIARRRTRLELTAICRDRLQEGTR